MVEPFNAARRSNHDDWVERLVAWGDLLIDIDRQTVCAFDFAEAESAAISELGRLREQQKVERETKWREAAEARLTS